MSGNERDATRGPAAVAPEVRAYAAASARLDEAPSDAARAAILAAARDAAAANRRRSSSWSTRWPLAAAATVLISTIAVLLAQRVEHDAGAPPEPAALREQAAQQAPASREARSEQAPAALARSQAAPELEVPAQVRTAPEADERAARRQVPPPPPPAAPARNVRPDSAALAPPQRATPPAPYPGEKADASAYSREKRAPEPATGYPPAVTAAPPAVPSAGARGDAAPDSAVSAMENRDREVGRVAEFRSAPRSAPSPPPSETVSSAKLADRPSETRATAAAWRSSLKEWIAHIARLRSQGRVTEADEELVLLRRQHPSAVLPPEALPRASDR